MTDLLRSLSSSDAFMPHGMCYLWEPNLLWLHFTADVFTGLAYWAIPPALLYLVVRARKEVPEGASYGLRRIPYDWMFVAFGVFIVACGATHFMNVWTIWAPRYWLSGGVKAVTAVASVATAVALPPLVPRALDLIRDARDSELRRRQLESANRELEELSEKLQAANRLKTELVANVSHEFRTPLTLILGPTDELEERDDLPPEVHDALDVIRRNARSLLGQVDELLDVARLDLGTMRLEPAETDVAGLLADTVQQFQSLARRRGISLELERPDRLVCRIDRKKLERVFLNLLSNALKFTPDGGRVRCLATLEDHERPDEGGGRLLVEVRDSGPGVPEELREQVFERFRQVDEGSTRRHRGTGLGLAITRELVELHGGVVDVDDAPEGGARFRVRIPLEREAGGAGPDGGERDPPRESGSGDGDDVGAAALEVARLEAAGSESATETGAEIDEGPEQGQMGGRILVVEDDTELRPFLANVLAERYEVVTAEDGVEALTRLDEQTPDLILTDIMMPRMDGEELLARIRQRPDCRNVPVVVLTARADSDLATRLLRMGAQDYLTKPVSLDELRARVGTHMEKTRSRRILQRELTSREMDLELLASEAATRKRRLEESLEQQAVLVRELHHRVKGNLQTISSLLNLQIRRTEDSDAREVLQESRGRIGAMAVLHEKLFQMDDPTRTRMDAYLRSLMREVSQSWTTRGASAPIRTVLEGDPVVLDAERAVTCGLLVHELLSNAFRHAFPDDRGGTVRVVLEEARGGGEARITVADDGIGLPDDVDADAPESLGLELVRSLVAQLEGTLEWERERTSGTEWRVAFPLSRSRPAPPSRPAGRRNRP